MTDIPFGLESKCTYAALSPADLQSLGKRAAVEYLSGTSSLNDSIVKIARGLPSISTHQIRRIVEFANQETFSRLFADNEKYASDKNIDFDVADPAAVLLEINNGAIPQVMSAPPDEYSSSPVKLGHSTLEADVELTRTFLGFDPALPGSEMTSYAQFRRDGSDVVVDRVLSTMTKQANSNGDEFSGVVDRILSGRVEHKDKLANLVSGIAAQPVGEPQPQTPPVAQGEGGGGDTHNEQMLELQREIELAKKRQELQKVEQQTLDSMNPQGAPGSVPAPAPAAPSPDAGAAAAPEEAMPQEAAAPVEEPIPSPAAGPVTVPPGSEGVKMGSMVDQALGYIKSARPHAPVLSKVASDAFSLESIKKATAHRNEYPWANPYGELIRTKQKLAKLLEESKSALGKNRELHKEATVRFQKAVAQHLWDGGNLGEVAHLMSAVHGDSVSMKTALASALPELQRQGLDIVKAEAAAIQYEMEKGASARTPNLGHPIAAAYSDLHKISEATVVLDTAWTQIKQQYDMAEKALQEGMVHASSI